MKKKKIVGTIMALGIMFLGFHTVAYAGTDFFEGTYGGMYYQARISVITSVCKGEMQTGSQKRLQIYVGGRELPIDGSGLAYSYLVASPEKLGTSISYAAFAHDKYYFEYGTAEYYINGTKVRRLLTLP